MDTPNTIEIYQTEQEGAQLDVRFESETVWLNRNQMAVLFDRDIKTIGKHINNIFTESELEESSTVAKFATVQKEGKREIHQQLNLHEAFDSSLGEGI